MEKDESEIHKAEIPETDMDTDDLYDISESLLWENNDSYEIDEEWDNMRWDLLDESELYEAFTEGGDYAMIKEREELEEAILDGDACYQCESFFVDDRDRVLHNRRLSLCYDCWQHARSEERQGAYMSQFRTRREFEEREDREEERRRRSRNQPGMADDLHGGDCDE